MGWVRIDDTHQDHPKIVAAGAFAELLDIRAICYSARFETDGRIDRVALSLISRDLPRPTVYANKLVKVGRWRVASRRDKCDGWIIHDYLDVQPSKAERDAQRAAGRDRQRRRRSRRNGVTDADVTPESHRESRRESHNNRTEQNSNPPTPQMFEPEPPATNGQRAAAKRQIRAAKRDLNGGKR